MTQTEQYDYIIIGAGSAGCVLANRLSADPSTSVLLLEAGPEDKSMWLKIPAGTTKVFQPGPLNWGYFTEPEPSLRGRKIYWPRGKTLGGSSSINGMVYLRGHPEDYDQWERLGCSGWGWKDVMPHFRRSEDQQHGASELHGADGPLAVTDPVIDDIAGRLFIESAMNTGLPLRKDFNDGIQEGVGRAQVTIRQGRRSSTSIAFLHPIRDRANLRVAVEALAERVLLQGVRATGVRYTQGGTSKVAVARREVILCGGVINSPQLLMLSGIGPAAHLREHGIEVALDLPGVGENLQDHLYVYYVAKCEKSLSLNHRLSGPSLYLEALKYFANRSGYLNIGAVQATAFARAVPQATRPDVEVSFRPMSLGISKNGTISLDKFPGINASCSLLRPQARGRIRLGSANPHDYPLIYANYLDNPADLRVMREGLRWIRRTFETEPLSRFISSEHAPGEAVQSDSEWENFIRDAAQSVYHPVGTCAMGTDHMAVLDHELRVRGIDGLRVVDASVMPRITSSNTNAPTIMIGEKGAEMIRAAAPK
ncbi:GMC family oxidoreductase [Paraburkholderia sediminicola]|uniref:GMC family oxidoreductase n=1 Tax=Paraburkholderia sediminicola TaxID=458836 RepID=UPI000EAD73DD